MRKYETFFIIDPDLPDDVNGVVEEKLRSIVTSNKGNVLSYAPWGKKKLAYTVKKHSRGHYILMEFTGEAELVAELERNMRLDERVLKFITIKLEDRFDPEKEEVRQIVTPPSFSEDEEARISMRTEAELDEEFAEETEEEGEEISEDE